jgi:hypothetical protein
VFNRVISSLHKINDSNYMLRGKYLGPKSKTLTLDTDRQCWAAFRGRATRTTPPHHRPALDQSAEYVHD